MVPFCVAVTVLVIWSVTVVVRISVVGAKVIMLGTPVETVSTTKTVVVTG